LIGAVTIIFIKIRDTFSGVSLHFSINLYLDAEGGASCKNIYEE